MNSESVSAPSDKEMQLSRWHQRHTNVIREYEEKGLSIQETILMMAAEIAILRKSSGKK
ncbi:MAG: hypothetical protein RL661_201 [Pseudomonadota bacterium]